MVATIEAQSAQIDATQSAQPATATVTVTDERAKFGSRKFIAFILALVFGSVAGYLLREYTGALGIVEAFIGSLYVTYVGGNVSEAKAMMAGALDRAKALVAKPAKVSPPPAVK